MSVSKTNKVSHKWFTLTPYVWFKSSCWLGVRSLCDHSGCSIMRPNILYPLNYNLGRRKLFYSEEGRGAEKKVGHQGWLTTKNLTKTLGKTHWSSPQKTKFGQNIQNLIFRVLFSKIFFRACNFIKKINHFSETEQNEKRFL